jgi:tyrosyl-tRNA synthetase
MAKISTDEQKIAQLLTHNTEEVIIKESLKKKLSSGKKLRIKLGCDPSRPDLHLGHSIVIGKLKEFQDMGHQVVFIIGDYTGMIGDPSGKSKTRLALSKAEVQKNAKTYLKQVGKILNVEKTEIRFNSEWHSKLNFEDILKLTSKFTVARILERDEFTKRIKSGTDIAVSEMLYPMMQAYDSVMIKADIEIGGTDQKFNLLAGRELQKKMGMPEQDIITCPLLVGLDGKEKMSKSLDNYIGIAENANSMFGKIMSISDDMIFYYLKLLTVKTDKELKELSLVLKNRTQNPRELKVQLAKEIIALYNSAEKAEKAEKEFNQIFRDKEKPTDIPEIRISEKEFPILDLIMEAKLATTKSEARRLVEQGGVKINDDVQKDFKKAVVIKNGMILQVGKRKFVKITTK